jgi:VLRF1 release factor-like protein
VARFVGRDNVRKRLAPLADMPGRTRYASGVARFDVDDKEIEVRPPFGLSHSGEYATIRLGPLFDALASDYVVGAILVRLGGYAVGVFDGEALVASKVGTRFVKGRHKKGGSSANRFRRRREEQARALIAEAAETAAATLEPWRGRIDFVALGGDRRAVADVLAATPQLSWVSACAVARFFPVPDPRQAVLERFGYELYSAEFTEEVVSGSELPPATP